MASDGWREMTENLVSGSCFPNVLPKLEKSASKKLLLIKKKKKSSLAEELPMSFELIRWSKEKKETDRFVSFYILCPQQQVSIQMQIAQ